MAQLRLSGKSNSLLLCPYVSLVPITIGLSGKEVDMLNFGQEQFLNTEVRSYYGTEAERYSFLS